MSLLVIAEHDNKSIRPSTLNTLGAAQEIGEDLTLLIAGYNADGAAKAASVCGGVRKILHVDDPALEHALAEPLATLVASLGKSYTHILAPASTFGKNFLPRVAALLDVAQVSDITKIVDPDTFVRPLYAGNAVATVASSDPIKVMTVRTTAFAAVPSSGGSAPVEKIKSPVPLKISSTYVSLERIASDRPELTSARIVVSGGRGLQSKENFKLIEELADTLGAAVGASRAAVDAGYVPNDYQVGQTGKVVAPDLYIAIGISGAIQHLAGMKESKVIVAINKDEEAPIFGVSDYGIVGDLFQIVPELTRILQATGAAKKVSA